MTQQPKNKFVVLDHANKLADRQSINPNLHRRLQRIRLQAEPEKDAARDQDCGNEEDVPKERGGDRKRPVG